MDWLFEGLGTAIVAFLLGAAGGSAVTWSVMVKKTSQRQRARDNANQIQSGRDAKGNTQ